MATIIVPLENIKKDLEKEIEKLIKQDNMFDLKYPILNFILHEKIVVYPFATYYGDKIIFRKEFKNE